MKSKFLQHLVLVILLTIISCKKGDKNSPDNKINTTPVNVTPVIAKSTFAPAEIMAIPVNDSLAAQQEITGKFDTQDIKIAIKDKQAVLLTPDLPAGTHQVSFTYEGKIYTVSVTIQPVAGIKSADAYASAMQDSLSYQISQWQAISSSNNYTAAEKEEARVDAITYADALNDLKDQYQKMSAAEKTQFAQFMAANMPILDGIRAANNEMEESFQQFKSVNSIRQAVLSTNGLKTFDTQQVLDDLQRKTLRNYNTSQKNLVPRFGAVVALIGAPIYFPVLATAGTAVAAGAGLGYLYLEISTELKKRYIETGYLEQNILEPLRDLKLSAKEAITSFNNNETKNDHATLTYKHLDEADGSSAASGSLIKDFIAQAKEYKRSLRNIFPKIPTKYKPTINITELTAIGKEIVKDIHNQYLSITNISNPNVTLSTAKKTDGSINFTASTTQKTDQTFTYDLVYSDKDFSAVDIKQTVNAKVIAEVDSLAIYQAAVIGNWVNTRYDQNGSGIVDEYVVKDVFNFGQRVSNTPAGGVYYRIPDGDFYNVLTWSVYKNNNAYYFRMVFNNRSVSLGGQITKYPNMEIKTFPEPGTQIYTILKKVK